MKIYKVTYRTDQEGSEGFYFTASMKDAKTNTHNAEGHDITECDKEIETIEVTATKKGIIELLNRHAGHNDNG